MRNIYRSLLLILATATQKELARYVSYLKAENNILRSRLPARIVVEPAERRRLVRLAAKLGRALDDLVTIVLLTRAPSWNGSSRRSVKNASTTSSCLVLREPWHNAGH
jgi:putative transposase